MNLRAVAIVVCALLAAPLAVESAAVQDAELRIVVIEGEDRVNIISQDSAVPTVVEARDRNDLPVSGASVLFLLGEGGTASLNAGLQQVALTTNALGQAAVMVNPLASGAVQLSVNAAFQGQTAATVIAQTNFATLVEAAAEGVGATGGGLGTGAVLGIVGAAVGAAVAVGVAVTGGDSTSPPPASVPSAPTAPVLTPGDGELGVRWTAPVDNGSAIDDYDVRYGTGGAWTELPDGAKSTATTATIPGLTNGTAYQVQVRAGNAVGDGAWSSSATGTPVVAVDDRPALIDLYNATNGANWTNNTNWNSSEPLGRWYGVSTNANGRVTGLRLGDNELTGSIPSSLGSLSNLEQLELGFNELTGSIPSSLGSLTNLTLLNLFYNELTGSIPSSLGSLTNLTVLQFQSNQLTGSIPSSLGSLTNMRSLWLSSNQLSGSIPSVLGSLTNLEVLYLARNELTGSIPSSLGRLRNLRLLRLSGNELTGSIPSSLGSLTYLEHLHLSGNELTGSIPSSLGSLTNLEHLGLRSNGLTGSIPSSLGSLTNLEDLFLSQNGLTGSIPSSLGSLTNLEVLFLGGNQLTGSIPSSLGSLTNLEVLFLGGNQLTGSIPSSLGSLTNLQNLSSYGNQLTGSIPSSLGSLTNLQNLSLYRNQLTGSIPAALCQFRGTINPQQGDVVLPCASSAAAAQGLAALSVSDARAEEAVGAAVAFAVTLSHAASAPVTVDYATRDGSARAGADYAAASGTLTFAAGESSKTVEVAVLDDAHDEGEETFVLALSNVSGARLEDAEATGTIENTDLLPVALLARFGRASAQHVVEHVEARIATPRAPGFRARLAGREVRPGMARDVALDVLSQFGGPAGTGPMGGSPMGAPMPGVGIGAPGLTGHDLRMGGAASLPGYGAAGSVDVLGSVLPGGDLLSGAEFELNREQHGGVISVWSRSARSSFGGRQGALSLTGGVRTTMVGADYTRGRLVAGLSLARSQGLGGYDGRHVGQVEASATGLYPWLGYKVNDRVSVWGVTGYGAGALRLTPDRALAVETGLSMAMAAAGTRGELVGSRASGGFALAFTADALWVGTSVDGVDSTAGRLSASEAAVTRVRTGIEGSRGFTFGGRMSLTPRVEMGLRQDGGDAETGTGVDVGGGLAFTDAVTGLSLDVQMRTLVAHQAEGFTDRGLSLSFGWNPTPSSPLGLTARVAPSWGGLAEDSEGLWRGGPRSQFGAYGGQAAAGRVEAELSYGLPVGRRFVGTPRVGVGSSAYGRTYQFGYRLGALGVEHLDVELGVDAQRRERPLRDGSDLGVLGRASVRW